ncbi:hypothetical protein VTN00DRAFT_7171, partial [Thermoascus crustaceus]|uniref:uncharacterized protein n=1 Tax=Thermoascus crustaceus TaxID=5088 RepID=UPI003743BDB1
MGLTGSCHVGPDGGIDESTALNISNNANYAESSSSHGTMSKPELPSSRDISGDIEGNGTERALLSPQAAPKEDSVKVSTSIWGVISVLLLGEFVANADTTLIFASAGKISSEFSSFQDANWLSTAYTLGVCVAQPVYGKLGDIYGRKPLLLLAYALFALGSLICGLGREMWQVILGRAISGIGGAGTMTVAAVIITDLVPKREIAAWRAYVNISMTLGRSLGGPTGGWLTDTFGWRWVFLIQAPLFCITALLVTHKLHDTHVESPDSTTSSKSKLNRVDFLGT